MKYDEGDWLKVLVHRPDHEVPLVINRLERAGASPEVLSAVLDDTGDGLLHALVRSDEDAGWAEPYGGAEAVALLASELEAHCAYAQRRAAHLRSSAFVAYAYESSMSMAEIGRRLGISRQAVAKAMNRPSMVEDFARSLLRRKL